LRLNVLTVTSTAGPVTIYGKEQIMSCELEQARPQAVASIRTTARSDQLGEILGQLFGEVSGYLGALGVQPSGPPFARYHSWGEDEFDMEAGFPVPAPVAGTARVQASELPGGPLVSTWHVGPYDTIEGAYEALEAWAEAHERELAEGPWEVYWTDPNEVPNPAEWKTKVVWPLE
jgi:effector-binding domain-containing protein